MLVAQRQLTLFLPLFRLGPLGKSRVPTIHKRQRLRMQPLGLVAFDQEIEAAGMIAHIREGRYGKDDVLVFVHTGGTPAVFTWNSLWL